MLDRTKRSAAMSTDGVLSKALARLYRSYARLFLRATVAHNQYGAYCVPTSSRHRPAARMILSGEAWEEDTIVYMTSHCAQGDVIHAGTFFGDFLPALSHACAPDALIWAFEPNPENYRCAAMTVAINGLKNVRLFNAGLGDTEGPLQLQVLDERGQALGGGSSFTQVPRPMSRGSVSAAVLRIDGVVPRDRAISILQLDVEGFEQPALSGALETIRRWKPIIIVESVPPADWMNENIFPLGYKPVGRVATNTIFSAR